MPHAILCRRMDCYRVSCTGIFIKRLIFLLPSFILAFVLASLVEISFRRSLMLSSGSFTIFVNRPVCQILLVLIAFMIFSSIYGEHKRKKQNYDVSL